MFYYYGVQGFVLAWFSMIRCLRLPAPLKSQVLRDWISIGAQPENKLDHGWISPDVPLPFVGRLELFHAR